MAEIVWTEPALIDLNIIAEYIAFDKESAAKTFVQKVLSEVELLSNFPKMGKVPQELNEETPYRELVISPCRIFYRESISQVFIVHIMRGEQLLKIRKLER